MTNPDSQQPPEPNLPKSFIGRVLVGVGLSFSGWALAFVVVSVTRVPLLGFIPLIGSFAVAVYLGLKQRRFGYVTGVILTPFLVVSAILVLLMIIYASNGGRIDFR